MEEYIAAAEAALAEWIALVGRAARAQGWETVSDSLTIPGAGGPNPTASVCFRNAEGDELSLSGSVELVAGALEHYTHIDSGWPLGPVAERGMSWWDSLKVYSGE